MTGKVVGIHGSPVVGEPVPNVVEALEEMLAEAKAGDLRAIAFVTVQRDGVVGTSWEMPDVVGDLARSLESHALGSGILMLGFRYAQGGFDD